MNIIVKLEIDKASKSGCDMLSIAAVSSVATKQKLRALLNYLYSNPEEYLEYANKKWGSNKNV